MREKDYLPIKETERLAWIYPIAGALWNFLEIGYVPENTEAEVRDYE